MRFDHISIEQGLSDLTVFCFAQDSSGFLWFGTTDGLNKYDGHIFTVFRSDPADTTSMAPGAINCLCVDHSGTLWIGTGVGLSILQPDSSKPRRLPQSMKLRPTGSQYVNWLETLGNGDVAIGTSGGFYLYKKTTSEFTHVLFDTLEPLIVTTFSEAHDGTLWIGTVDRDLIAFNPSNGKRQQFLHDNGNPMALHGTVVNRVVEDRDGRIWVATNNCVSRLHAVAKPRTNDRR
jgi:ligand-binding sensor domain-containing protein